MEGLVLWWFLLWGLVLEGMVGGFEWFFGFGFCVCLGLFLGREVGGGRVEGLLGVRGGILCCLNGRCVILVFGEG